MRISKYSVLLAASVTFFDICAHSASSQEVLRSSILTNGKVAGSEVDTFLAGGRIESTVEFNDRGRGPKLSSKYVFGAKGFRCTLKITGNDYLKAPVNEHFDIEGDRAHWKSTSEKGSAAGCWDKTGEIELSMLRFP